MGRPGGRATATTRDNNHLGAAAVHNVCEQDSGMRHGTTYAGGNETPPRAQGTPEPAAHSHVSGEKTLDRADGPCGP